MSLPGNPKRDPSVASRRGLIMAIIVGIFFLVIALRLWSVQLRQGAEFAEKSRNNFFQFNRLEHDRGEIVDREGRVLVTNMPSVNVYLTPAFFPPASRMVLSLGRAAGLSQPDARQVSQALSKAVAEEGPPILLARDVKTDRARSVRALQRSIDIPLEAVPIVEMDDGAKSYAIYIDPNHFPSTGRVLRRLRDILELTEEETEALEARVRRARGLDKYLDIIVRRDVAPRIEGRLALEVQLGDLPGVSVRRAKARHYRFGQLAAHLLGYVNELSAKEFEEKRDLGYRLGDSIGRRGVERTFEDEMRGTDGRETVVVDSKRRTVHSRFAADLQASVGERIPPKAGNRVVLTIDLDLQRSAEEAFDGKAGAIVVMEVHTGRLLALTSTPSFNPNLVSGYFDPVEKSRLKALKNLRPWRFRALQDHFAPGSTFKVVTAIAALSRRVTTESERIFCPGSFRLGNTRFRCWKEAGHGPIDLRLSLARSCDVYYYTMGKRLGLNPIAEVAFDLGFGTTTGIGISGESAGIIPTESWYNKRRHIFGGYTLGSAVNASIGQGAVTVTPIQLALAYATIANGGSVYEPQIALRIETNDGSAVREIAPKMRRQLKIPPRILAAVTEGLRQVVNEPFGTAYYRRLKDIQVAGKTGTAQVAKLGKDRRKSRKVTWKLMDHAWFSAFAPALEPQIVVVVFSEHGGGGSKAAAPIAMKVVDAWHKKQQLHAKMKTASPTIALIDGQVSRMAVCPEGQECPRGTGEAEWTVD